MRPKEKPSIIPTFVSSRNLVWSSVLVALFLACLFLHFSRLRAIAAAAEYAKPVGGTITACGLSVQIPDGWQTYSVTNGVITLTKNRDTRVPFIEVNITESDNNLFRALDCNPSLVERHLYGEFVDSGLKEVNGEPIVALQGSEVIPVRAGVSGLRFLYDIESTAKTYVGSGVRFNYGTRDFFVWGIADSSDAVSEAEIRRFTTRTFETLHLPAAAEEIERPVIHSGHLTAESNRKTLNEAERELAMWRLFSERAESEPAAALLPAIRHFREAIRLLASIRQETGLIASKDYSLYRELMARRSEEVRAWFVLLDKHRAMGDREAAKQQATYIRDHATLMGEANDARRAADELNRIAQLEAAEKAAQNERKDR